jgi:aspartyl-tRNA(Asn)/glutamyl-tRNA(Gln) amidotransferase subunit A
VDRLLAEDAIIIGRTNCDEFAMGSSNENSYYGNVKNPLNGKLTPGGSSGGAAASVTAGMCLAALGSDTGGSIRQPASFCGVVGLKPTYGRVSRHGLIAYASSFDQIGPITRSIADAALLTQIISGPDDYDSTLSQKEVPDFSNLLKEKTKEEKKKIAYLDCYVEHEGIHPAVKDKTLELLRKLEAEGHQVERISFDYLDYLVPAYYVLTTAEASSNLARYDGIHYGYRSANATDLQSTYYKSRTEGFGPEVKRRIMLGTYVLSAGYYDAYFSKAQKVRRIVQDATNEVLEKFDFILSPTTPHPAFALGSQKDDPIKMYLEDIFTVQANLAGLPAISLPLYQVDENSPFGIQLMSKAFSEVALLQFSNHLINTF